MQYRIKYDAKMNQYYAQVKKGWFWYYTDRLYRTSLDSLCMGYPKKELAQEAIDNYKYNFGTEYDYNV